MKLRDFTPSEEAAVLVVSPIEEDRTSLRSILESSDWKVHEAKRVVEAMDILSERQVPLILCERELMVGDWKALLDAVQLLPRPPYVIVASRHADDRLWAEVLNLGGYDVLAIPFDAAEVARVVHFARLAWGRRNVASPVAAAC